MYRGTTPTFLIELPDSISVSSIDAAFLTFEQNGDTMLEKDLTAMTLDTTNNTIAVVLTQEETLAFAGDKAVRYQLRFTIGGSAYATQKWQVTAEQILKDGVI